MDKLLKIIQSKKIWLTDLASTNDYQEIKYGNDLLLKHYMKITDADMNKLKKIETEIKNANHAGFAFCMSKNADQLSQWRGYADDGHGVSIGIEMDKLVNVQRCYPWYGNAGETYGYEQVMYSAEAMEESIFKSEDVRIRLKPEYSKEEISIKNIKELLIKSNPNTDFEALYKDICIGVSPIAFFVKNSSFEEECEWRIVRRSPIDKIAVFGGGAKYFENPSGAKHFEKNGRIIGYHEYDFKKYDPIMEIVFGPKCLMDVNEMTYILSEYNMANVKIKKSISSYR